MARDCIHEAMMATIEEISTDGGVATDGGVVLCETAGDLWAYVHAGLALRIGCATDDGDDQRRARGAHLEMVLRVARTEALPRVCCVTFLDLGSLWCIAVGSTPIQRRYFGWVMMLFPQARWEEAAGSHVVAAVDGLPVALALSLRDVAAVEPYTSTP